MINISYCNRLLQSGVSLLVATKEKIPAHPWKDLQQIPASKEQFEKYYNLEKAFYVGLVTGYQNIEVIDVDLKVLNTLSDQHDFWNELKTFISDNIDDFENKFVIYKTVNNGYHIIYKCDVIEGNQKLAKLRGQNEAIIETRGIGGYVVVYEKQISKNDYTNIQEISVLERDVLFSICRSYDYNCYLD